MIQSMLRTVLRTLFNPRLSTPSPSRPQHQLQDQPSPSAEAPALPRTGLRLHHLTGNFPLLLGGFILIVLFIATVFGPLWTSYDPYLNGLSTIPHFDVESMTFIRPPFDPSWQYPLGTDRWGNDLLSLIVYGARMTLVAAAYITLARLVIGAVLGSIAGWYANGLPDRLISGLLAVFTSLPALIASLILTLALGPEKGLPVFLIALTVVGWTEVAQYVRGEIMVLAQQGFIEGARAAGLTELQIVVRHIWPNLLPHLLVLAFLEMGTALILLAEMGFLGVFMGGNSSIQLDLAFIGEAPVYVIPENPEWGALVAQGAAFIRAAPHVLLAPAGAFLIAVVGLNAFGEGLRRLLDYTSVSTAFLLRKQMILVLALFVAATAMILGYTGPRRSYARLARSFDGDRALQEARRLAQVDNPAAAAFYVAQKLEEAGVNPGFPQDFGKTYLHTYQTQRNQLLTEPTLAVLDDSWRATQTFAHGEAFGYALEGAAGAGEAVAPVTILHFRPDDPTALRIGFQNVPINERIVLLSSAPLDYVNLALQRGARGVLVLSDSVASQPYVADRRSLGPVFFINRNTAAAIAAKGGNDLDALLADTDGGATRVYGDLGVTVHMSLQMDEPVTVDIPVVLGFIPGYDQGRAAEVVILSASLGGSAEAPMSEDYAAAGVMVEVARSWQEQNVNPRRSLLLLGWGGDPSLVPRYIQSELAFGKLIARVPTETLFPAALVHVATGPGHGPWIDDGSSETLGAVIGDALVETDVTPVAQPATFASPARSLAVRHAYLHWSTTSQATGTAQSLQGLGQVLSHTLIRLLREDRW